MNSGSLLKTFWVAAVLAVLIQSAQGQVGKNPVCCKRVSYNEPAEEVYAYQLQRSPPPCLIAVIFFAKNRYYCIAVDAEWIPAKIAEINKKMANATRALRTKRSLLSIIAKPSSSTPSSSS